MAAEFRIIPCEYCGTEGRVLVYVGCYQSDPEPHDPIRDDGPCPVCEGTGSEVVEVELIEMEDLECLS